MIIYELMYELTDWHITDYNQYNQIEFNKLGVFMGSKNNSRVKVFQ